MVGAGGWMAMDTLVALWTTVTARSFGGERPSIPISLRLAPSSQRRPKAMAGPKTPGGAKRILKLAVCNRVPVCQLR